ncbi:hypothetical protein EJ02DRAFT_109183 [Clathrospora elynae]|uniref:Uncharacterized protein n=1 Tax=Clathrospora elynae TaxID=706981 RepID=A0A6A5SXM6_9PLEO|nr:hypothetical protein EJ02DRAFT_109183 [Clathrospora elynae]
MNRRTRDRPTYAEEPVFSLRHCQAPASVQGTRGRPALSYLLQGISELHTYKLAEHPLTHTTSNCFCLLPSTLPINRALCNSLCAKDTATASALSSVGGVLIFRRLPRNLDASLSLPRPFRTRCDNLQRISLFSNHPAPLLAISTPIQPGTTRLNVRSVTLLHTARMGIRDAFFAVPHVLFFLQLLSFPVLSLSVSRVLF